MGKFHGIGPSVKMNSLGLQTGLDIRNQSLEFMQANFPSLKKLRNQVPAGVLELLTVPGLRPDKVLRLYNDLGVASLAELDAADDRIKKAKGLGAALQTKILESLAIFTAGPPCSITPRARSAPPALTSTTSRSLATSDGVTNSLAISR